MFRYTNGNNEDIEFDVVDDNLYITIDPHYGIAYDPVGTMNIIVERKDVPQFIEHLIALYK